MMQAAITGVIGSGFYLLVLSWAKKRNRPQGGSLSKLVRLHNQCRGL